RDTRHIDERRYQLQITPTRARLRLEKREKCILHLGATCEKGCIRFCLGRSNGTIGAANENRKRGGRCIANNVRLVLRRFHDMGKHLLEFGLTSQFLGNAADGQHSLERLAVLDLLNDRSNGFSARLCSEIRHTDCNRNAHESGKYYDCFSYSVATMRISRHHP